MSRKYKNSLKIIGIFLIFLLFLTISYINYKNNNKENTIVLVQDGLSINYLNGNKINSNNEEKTYTISITNNTEASIFYNIKVSGIESNIKDDVFYSLKEKNNQVNIEKATFPLNEFYMVSFIEIAPHVTHTYYLNVMCNNNSSLKANLAVGTEEIKKDNFAAVILAHHEIKNEPMTKIGEVASLEKEGIIKSNDTNGLSYYFRGASDDNYVSFANLLWRIVKINGDGSVKLILDDYIDESANYYNVGNADPIDTKLNFVNTNIYHTLQNWYTSHLKDYDQYLVSTKYCINDSVGNLDNETNVYYLSYLSLLENYNPSTTCLGNEMTSRIGLLTADEAVFAGASKNSENTSFYLYVPNKNYSWWTLTPAKSTGNSLNYFEINEKGLLSIDSLESYYRGIRPVITIIKNSYVTGTGKIDDPYVFNTD